MGNDDAVEIAEVDPPAEATAESIVEEIEEEECDEEVGWQGSTGLVSPTPARQHFLPIHSCTVDPAAWAAEVKRFAERGQIIRLERPYPAVVFFRQSVEKILAMKTELAPGLKVLGSRLSQEIGTIRDCEQRLRHGSAERWRLQKDEISSATQRLSELRELSANTTSKLEEVLVAEDLAKAELRSHSDHVQNDAPLRKIRADVDRLRRENQELALRLGAARQILFRTRESARAKDDVPDYG